MERWLSGLKRLPAKQEPGKPGTRVRIPLSPPTYAKATVGTARLLLTKPDAASYNFDKLCPAQPDS